MSRNGKVAWDLISELFLIICVIFIRREVLRRLRPMILPNQEISEFTAYNTTVGKTQALAGRKTMEKGVKGCKIEKRLRR